MTPNTTEEAGVRAAHTAKLKEQIQAAIFSGLLEAQQFSDAPFSQRVIKRGVLARSLTDEVLAIVHSTGESL